MIVVVATRVVSHGLLSLRVVCALVVDVVGGHAFFSVGHCRLSEGPVHAGDVGYSAAWWRMVTSTHIPRST